MAVLISAGWSSLNFYPSKGEMTSFTLEEWNYYWKSRYPINNKFPSYSCLLLSIKINMNILIEKTDMTETAGHF